MNPSSESKDSNMFFIQSLKATRTSLSGSSIRFNKDPMRIFTLDSSLLKSRCLQRWGIFSINAEHGWVGGGKEKIIFLNLLKKIKVLQFRHKAHNIYSLEKWVKNQKSYFKSRFESTFIKYYIPRHSHNS